MNRILITGGAGFIGSKLSRELVSMGCEVTVLDSLIEQVHGPLPEHSPLYLSLPNQVKFIRGDVCCQHDLEVALDGVDTVVHLAAETGTGQSMYELRRYTDVNIGGTALLLDLIINKRLPIKRLVVASSRAVYGEGKYFCDTHGAIYPGARQSEDMAKGDFGIHCPFCNSLLNLLPTDECSPVNPLSIYGVTKLSQEQMMLTIGRALGISTIAFRYQNVYGPGQSLCNPYTGILSIFSTRIKHGKSINIFEDGKESRDFVYIDDVVKATLAGILSEDPLVDVFNVGSGEVIDVLTVARMLQESIGQKVSVKVSGQFRVGDIRHNLADLSKIRNILGYEPSVGFLNGLKNFTDWANAEISSADFYEDSINELKTKGLFK